MNNTVSLPELSDINPRLITKNGKILDGFIENIKLDPKDIYMPKEEKGGNNNVTRKSLSQPHISSLQTALKDNPDWSLPLIVVKRIPGGKIVNGKTYSYQLSVGVHRNTALLKNGTNQWIYALYEFKSEKEELIFQAVENDHKPQNPIDHAGLVNFLSFMVNQGYIENTANAMQNILDDTFSYVHWQTKKKAVNAAVIRNGSYTDVILRNYTEIKDFLENGENYSPGIVKYTHGGKKDKNRNEIGWTVKEGYEDEFIFNAMKSLNSQGIPSYFLCHVNSPSNSMSLDDRRDKMLQNIVELENLILKTVEYRKKYNEWPWRVEAFFPQNNVKGVEERNFIHK